MNKHKIVYVLDMMELCKNFGDCFYCNMIFIGENNCSGGIDYPHSMI